MDKLQKQFELLKYIRPDRGFVTRSRETVLAEKPRLSIFTIFKTQPVWLRSLSVGFALLLVVLGVTTLFPATPQLSSLQNADALAKESETLPSGIELQAVSYNENKNEIIKTAIAEIGDQSTRHLKEGVIESEMNQIKQTDETNEEIDQLLDSVTL